jgi:hypothetical protein
LPQSTVICCNIGGLQHTMDPKIEPIPSKLSQNGIFSAWFLQPR